MAQTSGDRIGVIGGGLGGLAAACTLAARGYRVVVFEKNPWLGGKAAIHHQSGYRFDMGPTILLMPSVLRRVFSEAGRKLEEVLDLKRLDPQWRSFFSDGGVLDLHADRDRMAEEIESFAGAGAAAGYQSFMKLSERLDAISQRYFFWRPIGGLRDMFEPRSTFNLQTLGDILAMRPLGSVASTIRAQVGEPRLAQMLDHFTQYVGSCPERSPAVLCGIAHMQTNEGVWYPMGGTGAVAAALVDLGLELGVEFRTEVDVEAILLDPTGKVRGLSTRGGEELAFAAVVSNCDSVRTEQELLARSRPQRRRFSRAPEPACSGVVIYLGLDRRYEQLLHHTFVFSRDPHEEFDWIYNRGEPAPDPTCYLCAPAATDPDVAPAGGEALYVLVHTPYLRPHHDWPALYPQYREVILNKLEQTAGLRDIRSRIKYEHWLTPREIHERYRVLQGAIYGLASHGRLTGAFKPGNRSREIPGLYLAGGSAHPGPGMPMVLMSGWIAADTLDRDGLVERSAQPRGASLKDLALNQA